MPRVEQLPAAATARASTESVEWIRKNSVILAAVALIGAQLCWKAYLLSHFYFHQDDFGFMDRAFSSGFDLKYFFTIDAGHLMPGAIALASLAARLSPFNWTLVSVFDIVLLAAAGFAMLRLLLKLFGRRPAAILIPLIIYLFTPLTLPGLSLWLTAILWLPMQVTTLMALGSHVQYVRTGRIGHAISAAAWLGAGMLFDDQGVLVPALLFALTAAYFVPGGWLQAARRALRCYWRAWAIYAGLAAGYLVLFLIKLQTAGQQPAGPRHISGVLTLISTLLRVGFIPAAVGGPWHWHAPQGYYGYAAETPVLTQITWVVAALVIAASLWYRRHAMRAWVILAAWIVLADLVPLVISRLSVISATLLGEDLHYVGYSAPILAICVGLAFWPVIGEDDPYRAARPASVRSGIPALILVGAFFVGSIYSGATYLNETSSAATRSYIANARSALARAKPGTVIVSGVTPANIMYAGYLGSAAQTSRVLGPLAPKGSRIRFTSTPAGVIKNLMAFNSRGRLRPALDGGPTSVRPAGKAGCWPVRQVTTRIPLNASLFRWVWTVQLWYSGPATTMQLQFGTAVRDVVLPAGQRDVYVPVVGGGSAVLVRSLSQGPSACISRLTVGVIYPARLPAIRPADLTRPVGTPARWYVAKAWL